MGSKHNSIQCPPWRGREAFWEFICTTYVHKPMKLQLSSFPNIQYLIYGCGHTSLFALSPSGICTTIFWHTYRLNTKLDTIPMQFSEVHLFSCFSAVLITLQWKKNPKTKKTKQCSTGRKVKFVFVEVSLRTKRICEDIVICSSP